MEHLHPVIDSDTRFEINPITRQIKNESSNKTTLMQGDHNSEQFTFTLDKTVEGHDMSLCNKVEVHYFNIDSKTKEAKSGVYHAEDFRVDPDDESKVVFSWLVSINATGFSGLLKFRIRYMCENEDGIITYSWNTAFFTGISIGEGEDAAELFETEYVDIIEQWKASVVQEITEEMKADVTAWQEAESAHVISEMTKFSEDWNDTLDVERVRIDELVAMRGVDGVSVYDFDPQSGVEGTIKSNGVSAEVHIVAHDVHEWTGGGTDHFSGYCIPPELMPMTPVQLTDLNDDGHLVAFIRPVDVNEAGWGCFYISRVEEHGELPNTAPFGGRYDLANIFIPELADIRVGADGTVYDSAGTAVREQIGGIDRRVTNLETTVDEMHDLVGDLNAYTAANIRAIADLEETTDSLGETVSVLNDGGLQIKDDVIKGQINTWLDDHPEATTTVQDESLTADKFTTDLKHATLNTYVTPEMFGAKGDGVADDTAAIQAAIDTDKPCHLLGTYRIDSPLQIIKNNQVLTIDGELRVYDEVGIVLNGSYNTITGGGVIKVYSDNATAIKRLVEGNSFGYSNEISIKSITNRYQTNNNIGVEITGSGNAGGACFDRITTTFAFFRYGVWIHPAENQNVNSWNTAVYIDSVFNACVQALVDEWHSGGSFLHGQIQPLYKGDTRLPADFDETTPLVKVGSHWLIDAFFWDMNSSANKYAVKVTGELNNITSHLSEDYFDVPIEYKSTNVINPFVHNKLPAIATAGSWGGNRVDTFDNTNDVLLNCLDNPSVVTKGSYDGTTYFKIKPTTSVLFSRFFDGSNIPSNFKGTIGGTDNYFELLFEFSDAKALRSLAVWARNLPDAVTYEIAKSDAPDVFQEVANLEAGKDYVRVVGGGVNCALWVMDANADAGTVGGLQDRNIVKLKIKMYFSEGTAYSIYRISAFDVAPDIARRSGGEFTGDASFAQGTGVVLRDDNGAKYRLTVGTDGTLSAVKI